MRKIAIASLALGLIAVSNVSEAQRAARSAFGSSAVNARQASSNKPTVTWMAGIATGDGDFDIGLMAGVSLKWDLAGMPVDLRFDPSFAMHGADFGGVDASIYFVNAPVAVEYTFKTTGGKSEPYVLGGLGLHYSKFEIDANIPGLNVGFGDSDTNLGLTIGGGVRLNNKFSIEARFVSIDEWTTIPILVGFRF